MGETPVEVFIIYDVRRENASVIFDWGDLTADASAVKTTRKGVQVEFSLPPPVRPLALTVTRPFFGRDTAFVRHLHELVGNSVLAKLLVADSAGTTSAGTVPVPLAEIEHLVTSWQSVAPPESEMSAESRAAFGGQSPAVERTLAESAADVMNLARRRLREWFVPVLLQPVVARHIAPSSPDVGDTGCHLDEPVTFHGRLTLHEDLARIGGIHPMARADILDGRLLLRARATGDTPSAVLMISCLGSESVDLKVAPGGGEFRAELDLPARPGVAALADDYACVLSVSLREERTSSDD